MITSRVACAVLLGAAITFTRTVSAQEASLVGVVLADSSEKPLANAEVSLTDIKRTVRSDSAGNFAFTGLKAGRHELVVRMVGYEAITTTLVFTAQQKIEGDFLLKPLTTKLAAVDVKAKATPSTSPRAMEFEEHQKRPGRFLKAEVFEKGQARSLPNILAETMPGMRFVKTGGMELLAASRGGGSLRDCYMQIVINNLIVFRPGMALFDLRTINTADIIGLEYYTVATTPNQYNGLGSQCGTVVIWTKN